MSGRKPDKGAPKLPARIANPQPEDVDELYGLEPVFEPGRGSGRVEAESFVSIECPWCGERLDVRVDVTAGEREYIDDCEVCCRPMELRVELDERGGLAALRVRRQD
ncbi:MAG: CPXCG motif-containing cysteine-rich protein [Steroidobacteraceae bacterium]